MSTPIDRLMTVEQTAPVLADGLVLSEAARVLLLVSLPILLILVVAGVILAALQAWLRLHDVAVSTAPRLIVGGLACVLLAPWMWTQLSEFARWAWTGGLP